ncbi:MAG: hypothetical protein ACREFJ_20650 [Acetobacteraceae bacterium]
MTPDNGALTWRTVAGFCLAAAFVAAVATPIVLWVEPTQREVVLRAAGALLAAGTLLRLMRAFRAAAELDTVSQVALLTRKAADDAAPDPAFPRLAAELRQALTPRPRMQSPLWTRLREIAARRDGDARPPVPGHRPGVDELERLLTRIEQAR